MSNPLPIIELLHTAGVHVHTFDALLRPHAAEVALRHEVRPDWLARARGGGLTTDLRIEVAQHLAQAAARAATVVCTCSTLGPVADEVARTHPSVLRIDRPMMEEAARTPGTCVVAVCLASTIGPTTELLIRAHRARGRAPDYEIADCTSAWPHFEAGDAGRYAAGIARVVESRVAALPGASCVVLAQASMAAAEPLLERLAIPVLSSPRLAAREALARARDG